MAEVFLAKSTGAGGISKFVAIKRILPQFSGNAEFIAAFSKKYGRVPSHYAAVAYDTAKLLDIAVRKVKGNTTDKAAFAAAVKSAGAELKSIRGPFKFNTNNMPVQNYYAFQTVKEGSEITVKLLGTSLHEHQDSYVSLCKAK